jgi:prepilin peptidase CpaA
MYCVWSEALLELPLLLLFPAAMAFAGAMDFLTMTIPNRISLALLAGFAVAAPVAGFSLEMIAMHFAAFSVILAIGIVMFSLGWLGGGDAKLMAAASLWIGFEHLVPYFAYVAVSGGALAIIMLLYRRVPAVMLPGHEWAMRLHDNDKGMPYGLAIAAAAMWIYPKTPIFKALMA